MTATEAQVAAARRALDALGVELPWVATRAAADAVVAAGPDPATIAADALREAAEAIRRTDRTCKVGAGIEPQP